jgi:hypothetical protein
MVEWGGHHGGWGGFGPPSYIVKKCPGMAIKHIIVLFVETPRKFITAKIIRAYGSKALQ